MPLSRSAGGRALPVACLLIACSTFAGATASARSTSCWSGLQTVPEYLGCLASIPLDASTRDCTLEILDTQFRSLYTYSGLVRNSSDSDAELAPGFNFSVHKMALGPEVDDAWAQLKVETSAGLFAMRIAQLFTKFQDAHTVVYINPLVRTAVLPPVKVEVRLDGQTGSMKFIVVEAATWVRGEHLVGKTISTVNGKAALEYFLSVAELRAVDKSRGSQLNRFLLGQHLIGVPPPDAGAFNVTFEDSSSADLKWMVKMRDSACGLGSSHRICSKWEISSGLCSTNSVEILKQCFSYNPDFGRLQAMMAKFGHKALACSKGGALRDLAELSATLGMPQQLQEVEEEPETIELLGDVPEPYDEAQRGDSHVHPDETADSAGGASMNLATSVSRSCEVLRVQLETGTVATVLKLQSFGHWRSILPCAIAAVDQAAEMSGGNLIIDVISNGGGDVAAGYALNEFLYHNMQGSTYRNTWDSCEWYDLPRNEELDWLVALSQKALPEVGLENASDARQQISELATRMELGASALAEVVGEWNGKVQNLQGASTCLRVLLQRFGSPEFLAGGENAKVQFSALYRQCLAKAKPFGGNAGFDIMGYRWSNKYPEPLSEPNWDYYTSTVTKIRGGEPRNFSSMTFLGAACSAYMAVHPKVYGATVLSEDGQWPIIPQSKLKHVTYLSDGLCGSTCSVSSSRPYLEGMATFVTFGGVRGEPMDITSFNGGNVATYQTQAPSSSRSLWKEALDTIADAEIFFPAETQREDSWHFLPLPLNIYSVTFAQRAEYLRVLGPKALPREWYLVPASYHLDIWTSQSLKSYEELSAAGRQKLYELYVATAALPPKPFARTLV